MAAAPVTPSHPGTEIETEEASTTSPKSASFWLVISSLCLIAFTSALDGFIIAIALLHILSFFNIGDSYVEMANCFVFTQTVAQPAIAQLCDLFGRR
ncbi:putative macrolide phosphotransferase k [Rosellinia necatrix]|uniref:Putative macrolide phosphotransferase k n=1 Tax=Rosellinia necatrix TaxID=77044 RepID=A0A1W2TAK7_ROSNE|nr:putative macrolide phosphotransferase k [Rosellinia necatrix]